MSSREGGDQLFQASSPQVSRGRPPRAILPFSPQQARQNAVQGHISLVSLVGTLPLSFLGEKITTRFILYYYYDSETQFGRVKELQGEEFRDLFLS